MENRELDAKCAEILGWTLIRDIAGRPVGVHPKAKGEMERWWEIPHYSTSLDAARELLEWAANRGCLTLVLNRILSKMKLLGFTEYSVGRLLLATPRQICEAFVECFGGDK